MSDKNVQTSVHIGLKLADGSFYPIFPENHHGSKRLVLTTVRDNQESVQIDLYKGMEDEVFEDSYIGSLVIENLDPVAKGSAEIELIIGIDAHGNLNASARDVKSGEQQALSVSLETLAQRASYEMPDFELETVPPTQPEDTGEETIVGETYPVGDGDRRRTYIHKKKGNPAGLILFILLGLVVIAGIAIGIYFLFPWIQAQFGAAAATPAPSASVQPSVSTGAITTTPSPMPSVQASVSPSKPPSPSPSALVSPDKGTWYLVVRGDTLWDIARQYYRDPFQYLKIARSPQNNIPNPDLIFENQRIFIPDK